jgi:hypothetical protein
VHNFKVWIEGPDFASFTPADIKRFQLFFSCSDCGINIGNRYGGIGEYGYILHPEVWKSLGTIPPNSEGNKFLCIECVEKRLGRKLTIKDFAKIIGKPGGKLKDRIENK